MLLANLVIEWTQISALCAVLALVSGSAVAYLRLFIKTELMTVERRILAKVSQSFESQKIASLKATQINTQITSIKDDMKDVKAEVKQLKKER